MSPLLVDAQWLLDCSGRFCCSHGGGRDKKRDSNEVSSEFDLLIFVLTTDFPLLYDSMSIFGCREAPQLVAVLKEMKEGLDAVRVKVQALTEKVFSYLSDVTEFMFLFCPFMFFNLLYSIVKAMIAGHSVSNLIRVTSWYAI